MDADLIPPSPEPEPESAPKRSSRSVVCEFCECKLTPDGEILKLGARARKLRDLEDELEAAEKSVGLLEAEITRLKGLLADAESKASATAPTRQGWRTEYDGE